MSDVAEKRIEHFASAARTATATSAQISIPGDATSIGIAMETTAFTSGTFTAKIQHSLSGDKWEDLAGATTGAIGAVGLKTGFASATALPLLRVVLTGATTPIATQSVYIVYG
jgi:hypothetical protein